MKSRGRIVIGTRGSALALKQTQIAAVALGAVTDRPVVVRVIETKGDIDHRPIPLDSIGKGWFTKEIEEALLGGQIDLAVHSLKDLPGELPAGLVIGAYLSREDARDVLVTKHGEVLKDLKPGATIGTDSTRRKVQLFALRSDLAVRSIRGNVPTRVQKMDDGQYDAIVIAAAGLIRLGMQERIAQYFSPQEITPAPGQGILAIEARANDAAIALLLHTINDPAVERIARIERLFSAQLGGGCKSPVGAYAYADGQNMRLIGMFAETKLLRKEMTAPLKKSDHLGIALAEQLLKESHASVI